MALLLTLPKSDQGKGEQKIKEYLTIEVSGEKIAYEGKKISVEDLSSKLQGTDTKTLINLRVDGDVKYLRLVSVLDVLQKHKLENVSLITEKKDK